MKEFCNILPMNQGIHEDVSVFIEEIVLRVFYSQGGGGAVLSCSSFVVYTLIAGTSGSS